MLFLPVYKVFFHEDLLNCFFFVSNRPVLPSVEPGYLHKLLPSEAPEMPESWQDVMKDIGDKIMPGMTHWQSPNFHAYYPTATSYPSIVGEIIAGGFGVVGFSWVSSIQEKNLFQSIPRIDISI